MDILSPTIDLNTLSTSSRSSRSSRTAPASQWSSRTVRWSRT